MTLRFTNNNWMPFLQDLMDRYQGLKSLNFIGEDGLTIDDNPPSGLHIGTLG